MYALHTQKPRTITAIHRQIRNSKKEEDKDSGEQLTTIYREKDIPIRLLKRFGNDMISQKEKVKLLI